MYSYRIIQILGVDRTNVRCTVDLGFGLTATLHFQLLGVDPPDFVNGAVTDYVQEWMAGRELIVSTTPYNGTVEINNLWLADFIDERSGEHLTAALIDAGYGS